MSSSSATAAAAAPPHSLDLAAYSLDELLDLFQLTYDMTVTDLKAAKQKVLMLHPDKSRLPADYFLFYKRALERIVELFEDIQKQNRPITKEATKYSTETHTSRGSAAPPELFGKQREMIEKETTRKGFNARFNELFEKNMSEKPDTEKNRWFSAEEPDEIASAAAVAGGVSDAAMERIRQKTAATAVARYTGVSDMYSQYQGKKFHEEGGHDAGDDENAFVCCDPFRTLRYEDIRRVHKDETIIPITTDQVQRAVKGRPMTVDEFVASRDSGGAAAAAMAKNEAERILEEKYKAQKQSIMEKQYRSNLKTDEYAKKNQIVMSHFLRIAEGGAAQPPRGSLY